MIRFLSLQLDRRNRTLIKSAGTDIFFQDYERAFPNRGSGLVALVICGCRLGFDRLFSHVGPAEDESPKASPACHRS